MAQRGARRGFARSRPRVSLSFGQRIGLVRGETMNWKGQIVTDPEVLQGKPSVRGTRLAVDFILGLYASGWTDAQVLESYPQLSRESIRAVFAYAAEVLGAEGTGAPRRRAI